VCLSVRDLTLQLLKNIKIGLVLVLAVVHNSAKIFPSNFYRNMLNRCQELSAFKLLENTNFLKSNIQKSNCSSLYPKLPYKYGWKRLKKISKSLVNAMI